MAEGSPPEATVSFPADQHIEVPSYALAEVLIGRVNLEDRATYATVLKLFEGLTQFEFLKTRSVMRGSFERFSRAARGHEAVPPAGQGGHSSRITVEQERLFISNFIQLMELARYKPLTKQEWATAQAGDYDLNMPVTVNWEGLDEEMLMGFWTDPNASDAAKRREAFRFHHDHANRCLVFHRGIGLAKKTDVFINEKIDMVLECTLLRLVSWVMAKLGRKKTEETEGGGETASGKGSAGDAVEPEEVPQHRNRKCISRITLYDHFPTLKALLVGLMKKVEVAEPTYKRTIVMYRSKSKPPQNGEASPQALRLYEQRKNNIYIKSFDSVPMADLEVIFPGTAVHLKPLSKILLLSTVVGALITGVTMIWTTDINTGLILSMMGVVAMRCFGAWTSMQTQKAKMMQTMGNKLYNKSLDSQEGVVYSIIQEMGDQVLSEMMLAYTLLLLHHSQMHPEDLDEDCEDFLQETFNIPVDFAIEESLPRLLAYGVVVQTEDGLLEALPLAEAETKLTALWVDAFKHADAEEVEAAGITSSLAGRVGGAGKAVFSSVAGLGRAVGSVSGVLRPGRRRPPKTPPPPPTPKAPKTPSHSTHSVAKKEKKSKGWMKWPFGSKQHASAARKAA